MTIFIPVKLTNGNTGRGGAWYKSAAFRDKVEKKLRYLGFARQPFPCRVSVTVTRILGKGERLWDSSSVLRGNWKEIEDALVALGWFVDDSTQYIATTDGRQDDTRRDKGPAIELTILPTIDLMHADPTPPISATTFPALHAGHCYASSCGRVRLYLGDWETLPAIPCDAVVTDPPYGIEADKAKAHSSIRDNDAWPQSKWDKQRPADETLRKLPKLAALVAVWGGNYFADCLPASGGWLIWRKPQAETGFSLADAELCWTSRNFAARMKTIPRRDGNAHPTQKPVMAMAWTMDALKVPSGATVFDPYMGSGTTGIACIRTGRRFIGVERDPTHYANAVERIRREIEGDLFHSQHNRII